MFQLDHAMPSPPRPEPLADELETEGFLVLPAPATLTARIVELWQAAALFFALPTARKLANLLPEYDGYHDAGKEYSDRPDRPDLAESFWARLIYAGETRRFPDREGRRMHEAALGAAAELDWLVNQLTRILSRHYAACWSPEMAFRCDLASHLQLNRYEPRRQTRDLLTDAHEDGLYLTLLFADAPGLEVLAPGGRWRSLQPRPGELIAMPGEIFSLLCGFRVQPLYHRVRNHPDIQNRLAMMYFANPNPTHSFEPWVTNETNVGIDIIERAIANPTRYGLPPLPALPDAGTRPD
jgi:isopenicillin N synthase-like dioxygenase